MIAYYADPELTGIMLTFLHRRESGESVRLVLAEGDSWFSIGGATTNLLMALDDGDTLIVSCASPGDTLRTMSSLGNESLWLMLSQHFGVRWDAVLLSAGGNDLLCNINRMLDGGGLDRDRVTATLDDIEYEYNRIIATIRQSHDCPIHAHTYDYPVSDPRGGWFRSWPLVGDKLLAAGIDPRTHAAIITSLIDGLAARLHRIAGLIVHDTRGTLVPGKWRWIGWQDDWRNEIHPTRRGYRRLAEKWRLT